MIQFLQVSPDDMGNYSMHTQSSNHLPKRVIFFMSLKHADKKKADEPPGHGVTSSLHLCTKKKTSTKRGEMKKNNAGTTISTSKSGFLRTYVKTGLATDNTYYAGDAATQLLCLPAVYDTQTNLETFRGNDTTGCTLVILRHNRVLLFTQLE